MRFQAFMKFQVFMRHRGLGDHHQERERMSERGPRIYVSIDSIEKEVPLVSEGCRVIPATFLRLSEATRQAPACSNLQQVPYLT
jgi:hypothetical protein